MPQAEGRQMPQVILFLWDAGQHTIQAQSKMYSQKSKTTMRIDKLDLLGQKEASETSLQLRMWTMKHNFFLRYCLCFGDAFLLNPVKRRNLLRRTYKNILQTIKCVFIDIRIKVQDRMGTSRTFLANTSANRREHEKLSNSHDWQGDGSSSTGWEQDIKTKSFCKV